VLLWVYSEMETEDKELTSAVMSPQVWYSGKFSWVKALVFMGGTSCPCSLPGNILPFLASGKLHCALYIRSAIVSSDY
jgi:hypothetical protein